MRRIGDLIDSLGVDAELADDDLVDEAVVVLRIHPASEHRSGVVIAASDDLTWVSQLGLIHAARVIVEANAGPDPEDA